MSAYLGRFHRIQPLYQNGMAGEVMILDRKKMILTPARKWKRTAQGIWYDQEGALRFGGCMPHFSIGASGFTTGAQTIIALDSNYVSGTSGDAIANRISIATNKTISAIYFFVTSYDGTAANVNDITYEVRSGTNLTPTTSAGGLVATGTLDPASATGWVKITGLSIDLTAGTWYWIIIGDPDGGATDTLNILQDNTNTLMGSAITSADQISATTANGWVTPTLTARSSNILVVFSDGTTLGSPFSAGANATSADNRKGIYISRGFPFRARMWGWASTASSAINGGEVIYDNAKPGGAVIGSSTVAIATTSNVVGTIFGVPPIVNRNQPVRLVHTFSGASLVPVKTSIGSGVDANLRVAMLGGGNWYWAEANGTTDWSNDDINAFPLMSIMFDEFLGEGKLISLN